MSQAAEKTEHSLRRRVRPDHWEILKEAADFLGQDVGTFTLSAGLEKAREVITEQEEFKRLYEPAN